MPGGDKFVSAPSAIALEGYSLGYQEWPFIRPRFLTWPILRSTAEEIYYAIEFRDWEALAWTPPYCWWESGRARKWAAAVLLPARQRLETNLELWLDAMDFSRVCSLALVNCQGPVELLKKLLPRVPGLRSLEIESRRHYPLALAVAPNTLQHLSLRNSYQPWDRVEPAVARQGQSLTSLEWRSDEWLDRDIPLLSPTEIGRLNSLAPRLTELTIDLKIHGPVRPWAELDALREEAPAGLANLTVYLKPPRLTLGAATAMYCRLVGGRGAERPWHTVRFLTGVWSWRKNPRRRHDPAAEPELNDCERDRSPFAWAICSAWRPDGSLKTPEEAPCDGFIYADEEPSSAGSDQCVEYGQYYARLAFESRQEVEQRLWV